MHFIRNSLIRQFMLGIILALILLSSFSALIQINRVGTSSEVALTLEVNRMLNQLQDKISSMLYSRNNQLDAIFTHPSTIAGIQSIQQRGINPQDHPALVPVTRYFRELIELDPSLVNLFFTTTATWEYYDQIRKNDDPNYYINKRPFWQEFLSQMNHYVNDPYRDVDGKFLMTFRSPIYNANEELIGTAGLDLDLDQVNQELAALQSSYTGLEVFVVSDSGLMVSFPFMKQQMEKTGVDVLATNAIDEVYQSHNAQGFTELWANVKNNNLENNKVNFKNKEYQVFLRKYQRDVPEVHWHIAVMIPTEAINAPVNDVIWETLISLILFTVALGIFVWAFTRWQLKPLSSIQEAMHDISQGSADLTQRIEMKREDELGQLAHAFNAFVEKIQLLVKESNELAKQFTSDAQDALNNTHETTELIEQQKYHLANVASASVEMDNTTAHVAKRTEEISHISSNTRDGVASGVDKIEQTSKRMANLAEQTQDAAKVVSELETETHSIGEVVEVIKGIADQTNLLALNAAIEAARAGEQGRGFAVVADEVRNLASRTQESTAHIHQIVAKLQASAQNAVLVMNNSQQEAEEGKEFTLSITPIFQNILGAMTDLEQHMLDISSTISEQSSTAAEMNRLIVDVDSIASDTVEKSLVLSSKIQSTEDKSEQLLENLGKFKF